MADETTGREPTIPRFKSLLLRHPDQGRSIVSALQDPYLLLAILAIIMSAFQSTFQSKELQNDLRIIKDHFRERDYDSIFESSNWSIKTAYAAKYSASRALCYNHLFARIWNHLPASESTKNVLVVGGGAGGELVAWSALLATDEAKKLNLTIVDYADWTDVMESLQQSVRLEWGLTDQSLLLQTRIQSILTPSDDDHFSKYHLISFMFVMNELFVDGKRVEAMAMIQRLAAEMSSGALLLLVESAGSFSHVQIATRSYMVYQLLDGLKDFDIVEQNDAEWYRVPSNLRYPLQLENMRYLFRLYRKH